MLAAVRPLGAAGQRHERHPHRDGREDEADGRRRQHGERSELRPLRHRHEEKAVDRDADEEASAKRRGAVGGSHRADPGREQDGGGQGVAQSGE
jgi:hypothetical protein